jgi:ribosomal protein S18 acetylase RimI-like enzyme
MTNNFQVDLVKLTPQNLGQLRLLNQHCFPIAYRESFYQQLLAATELARLAYFADCLVGAIGCKVESKRMYVMTLGVLEKYRRFGFATQLLDWVIGQAVADNMSEISLHVQTNNEGALSFYKNRGFVIQHKDDDYYPQLDPSSAYYLVRKL